MDLNNSTKLTAEFTVFAQRFGLSTSAAIIALSSEQHRDVLTPPRTFPIVEPAKTSSAFIGQIFDDLEEAFLLINLLLSTDELATEMGMSALQRTLFARFRDSAKHFAHDLLLADACPAEILRRLS